MPDPFDPSHDDSIDRAYRAALAAAPEANEPERALRRRRAVLAAVQATSPTVQPDKPGLAANDPRWYASAAVWRGLAAACVLVASSLVVTRLLDEGADDAGFTPAPVSTSASAAPTAPTAPIAATQTTAATQPQADAAPAERRPSAAKASAKSAAPAATQRPAPDAQTPRAAAAPATPQARDSEANRAAQMAMASGQTARAAPAQAVAQRALSAETDAARADANASAAAQALGITSGERAAEARPEARKAESAVDAAVGAAGQVRAAQARSISRPTAPAREATNATAPPTPPDSLLAAVSRGDFESAKQVLATVRPDAQQDGDGRSALALAVLRSDLAMVKLLLASGANRLAPDRFGQTPQGYATQQADPALRAAFGLP